LKMTGRIQRYTLTSRVIVACAADEVQDGIILEASTPSKEKKTPPRKPIRIRRVRQTKAKAKRRESKTALPIIFPDTKCRLALELALFPR